MAGAAAGSGPTLSVSLLHALDPALSLEAEFPAWSRAGFGAVAEWGRDTVWTHGKARRYAEAGGAVFAYPFGNAWRGLQLGLETRLRYDPEGERAGGTEYKAFFSSNSSLSGGCRWSWAPGIALTGRLGYRLWYRNPESPISLGVKGRPRLDILAGWTFL